MLTGGRMAESGGGAGVIADPPDVRAAPDHLSVITTEPAEPARRWPAAFPVTTVRGALAWWAATRLLLIGAFVALSGTGRDGVGLSRWPTWVWPFQAVSRWDAGHFLRISRHGYFWSGPGTGPGNPHDEAFFPGYPLAGRATAQLLGAGHPGSYAFVAAMAVITWVASAFAAVGAWRLVADRAGARAGTWALLVLLLGPYSIFLVMSYSEALFLALAIAAWRAGQRNRWPLACASALLACAVRVNGLFLTAGLAVLWWRGRAGRPRHEAALLALPLLAPAAFFGWLRLHTGRWDSWFVAERVGWDRNLVAPWTALANSIHRLSWAPSGPLLFQDVLELVFALALVAGCVVLARRHSWPELAYCGLTTVSLLTSSFYLSIPRSCLLCFPLLTPISQWFARPRHRLARWAVVAAGLAVLATNVWLVTANYWTG